MRRIALLGVSGVGKSTMVRRLAGHLEFMHVEASLLIKEEQSHRLFAPQSSEALRTGRVLDNQELLIAGFERAVATTRLPVIFDGHSVIDGRDGLVEIPVSVFAALGIDSIVFLHASAEEIHKQRQNDTTRSRPNRTIAEISEHQTLAMSASERIAQHLRCPLYTVENNDADRILTLLSAKLR